MAYKRKYEQLKEENDLSLNDDNRYLQRAFLDFLVEENSGFFEKRNNKKFIEKKELYGNLNEAKNHPKIDSKGKTYYEITYENIFGFMSTKKFSSLKDLEKYQEGVKKDIDDLSKKPMYGITAKAFKEGVKKFFTSGKCPDYSNDGNSQKAIVSRYNKSLQSIKDFISNKSEQDFFKESQLPPLIWNALLSIGDLSENERNEINDISLTDEEIMVGKANSLDPEYLEEEIAQTQKDLLDFKEVKINQKAVTVKAKGGQPLESVVVAANLSKSNVEKSIKSLIDTNELIEKLPWYKKVFGSKYKDLKKRLEIGYKSIERLGINKDLVKTYVESSLDNRYKIKNQLDRQIADVINSKVPLIKEGEIITDVNEKYEIENTIKKDFEKLNNKEVEIDNIELPDEIFADEIVKNDKAEVESNNNFIEQDSIDFDVDEIEDINKEIDF